MPMVKGQDSIDVLATQTAQKIIDEQQTLLEHDLIKQNETSRFRAQRFLLRPRPTRLSGPFSALTSNSGGIYTNW
jgi:hypothetical protein